MSTRKVYGYLRVSAKDQNLDRQLAAMGEAGISSRQLYMDRQSGKDFDRPGYRRLVQTLKAQSGGLAGNQVNRPVGPQL